MGSRKEPIRVRQGERVVECTLLNDERQHEIGSVGAPGTIAFRSWRWTQSSSDTAENVDVIYLGPAARERVDAIVEMDPGAWGLDFWHGLYRPDRAQFRKMGHFSGVRQSAQTAAMGLRRRNRPGDYTIFWPAPEPKPAPDQTIDIDFQKIPERRRPVFK